MLLFGEAKTIKTPVQISSCFINALHGIANNMIQHYNVTPIKLLFCMLHEY